MDPLSLLLHLAPQSAAAWHALGAELFPGEASVETANSVYRFVGGVFQSLSRKPSRSFEAPASMQGLKLIGFLADEGGLFSLSPRWRPGSHAVLWKPGQLDSRAFIVTSVVTGFALEEREIPAPLESGVVPRVRMQPGSVVPKSQPGSMTRIHTASAAAR